VQNELNQEQIDAMVRAARSGGADASKAKEHKVEPWDVRRAGQIRREQLQAITALHEGFARSLTHSLGAYLRVVFAATLVSAEHLTYREFLERVPETTYLASCRLEPMGVIGALQLDLKVALPIVDLLLGGEGKAFAVTREITEIEEEIVESVARIVCRDLGAAWQAVDLQVDLDKRVGLADAQRLMPLGEKTLSLSFEITMLEVRGGLNLAVPVSVSHALLRKISAESSEHRPRRRNQWRERVKSCLLDCPFPVELGVDGLTATVDELTELVPGYLLPLRRAVSKPASVLVAGVEIFTAAPSRCGPTRAAQVLQPVATEETASEANEMKLKAVKTP
jgi:flagellar motor switch protein FliM